MAEQYIRGFKTQNGIAKYDYYALANLPTVLKIVEEDLEPGQLPLPARDYVGTMVLVQDEDQNDVPYLCFEKSENSFVWVTFDGRSYAINQLARPEIWTEAEE